MSTAFLYGAASGTDSLNLHVVGGTTQPASPKEGTVWVNTATPVSGYLAIGNIAYDPGSVPEGTVMIVYDGSTPGRDRVFNILKKDSMWMALVRIYQYVGSAWEPKSSKIFTGGQWVDTPDGTFFDGANGGAKVSITPRTSEDHVSGASIYLGNKWSSDNSRTNYGFYITNPVDLTPYRSLNFVFSNLQCGNKPSTGHNGWINIGCGPSAGDISSFANRTFTNGGDGGINVPGTYSIDITNVKQKAYIGLVVSSYSSAGYTGYTCTKVWVS